MARIYPSIIAANPLQLSDILRQLEPYCAGFHCDIMDNHFVPNRAFDAETINTIDAATTKPLWVHLMVNDPITWCKTLSLKAHSLISFHIESTKEINKLINIVKENNWQVSIAIKPKTAIEETFNYLKLIDQLLVMSVEPGFSGQRFLDSVMQKVIALVDYRKKHNERFRIGMDGGINEHNIHTIIKHGVDDVAIASAIFNQPNPVAALQALINKAR